MRLIDLLSSVTSKAKCSIPNAVVAMRGAPRSKRIPNIEESDPGFRDPVAASLEVHNSSVYSLRIRLYAFA